MPAVVVVVVAAALAASSAQAQEVPSTTAPPTTTTPITPPPTQPPTTVTPVSPPTTEAVPPDRAEAPEGTIAEGTPTPAPRGSRNISGTIRGIDGNAVNAQISLVLRDSLDRPIHLNGQVHGNRAAYAALVSMNPNAPIEGLPAGGDVDWRIDGLPANAHHFTLEVYPRQQGSGAGVFSHYGGAVKRNIRLRPGQSIGNLDIVFPLNCANVQGGTTGSIEVRRFVNGQPVGNMSKFVATGADFPPFGIQGFRDQRDIPAGDSSPEFDGLAPDRRYGVEIFVPGTRFTFFEVPVRECRKTVIHIWSGRSPVPPRFTSLPFGARGPGFPIPGDFDGDGDDDLYFAAPGAGQLWMSDGSGTRFVKTSEPSAGSHKVVAGDFDGDGIDDLLFYGWGSRPDRIWDFAADGSHTVVPITLNGGGSGTYPVAGDFDNNRRTDVLFVSPNGPSTLRRFTAAGSTTSAVNLPRGFTVRAGDVDGDWQADLVLYRPLTNYGEVQAWFTNPNGTSFTRRSWRTQPARFQPVLADVSGDFKADLILYQPGSAIDVLWRGYGPEAPFFARESANLGITGNFLPTPGDWNGDGTDDLFLYGPGSAPDRIWRSNDPAWRVMQRHPAP